MQRSDCVDEKRSADPLFDGARRPLLIVDPAGPTVVWASAAAAQLAGCAADALVGSPLEQVLEPVAGDWSGLLGAPPGGATHDGFRWHRAAGGPLAVRAAAESIAADCGLLLLSVRPEDETAEAPPARPPGDGPLKDLFDASPLGIAIVDAERRIIHSNPALCRLLGYSAAELAAMSLADLCHPEDRLADRQVADAVSAECEPATRHVEGHFVTRHGNVVRGKITVVRIADAAGAPGAAVYVEDVTERTLAEQRLRTSERRYREIAEKTGAIPWEAEISDRRFTYVGPQAEELLGFPLQAWRQAAFWEGRLHPEDREWVVQFCAQSAAVHHHFQCEYRMLAADGRTVCVQDVVNVVREGGRPVRIRGFMIDVTQRREADTERHRSNQRFRNYFELGLVGMAVTSLDKDWMEVNQRLCEMLGYAREELLRMTWAEVVHADDLSTMVQQFNRALAGEVDGYSAELRLVRKDGNTVDVSYSTRCVYRRDGAPDHFVALIQDVSQRKQAEAALQQHQQRLAHVTRLSTMGELVAGVAHEINQPLYAISNFASACNNTLQADSGPSVAKVLHWTRQISDQATRAGRIIQRLKDFVRPGDSRREPIEVNELLDESIELLAFEASRHQVRVECLHVTPPTQVVADRVLIQQVLVNLLRNAYEAASANDASRRVVIAARRITSRVEISVADNGSGLPEQHSERIFDAFFTTKPDGMGMGLAVSRSIVQNHGGQLLAAPSALGGAEFRFDLPLLRDYLPHE